jgi:glycosyltransferase involved in cell wall biosynthesis
MNHLDSQLQKLIVIVPAYNEEERITETITAILGLRQKLNSAGFRLLVYVIDDGSKDETRRLAHEAGADRIISHRVNMGLGASVRTGLAAARADRADIVVKFDADLQHDPNDIPALIQPILDDEADVVYGNRFDRIKYKMPLVRRIGNIVFTGLMKWLTKWPVKDSQPGIFAINQAYLDIFHIPGDYNYTQQILLDAYHKGMRFAQVPVVFHKRTTGKSFVSIKYPFKVLPQIVIALAGLKPMRVFAPIGLLFLLIGGLVFSWEIILWFMGKTHKPVIHVNAVLGFSLFGLQTLFFGILAELIVQLHRK